MKDFMIKVAAIFSLLLVSNFVYAEKGQSYFGLGYHSGDYEADSGRDADFAGINLEFGSYLEHNLALQGNLVLGTSGESIDYKGIFIDIDLKYMASIFLRGDIPFNSQARVYGLLGLSHATLEASAFDKEVSESDPGLSYGLGFEGNLSRDLSVGAEYIFYLKEDNFEYNAFNISIRQIF